MSKEVDNLKDVLQDTLKIQRLNWAYQELLLDVSYYKHVVTIYKKIINNAIDEITKLKSKMYFSYKDFDNIIDILKGSDKDA